MSTAGRGGAAPGWQRLVPAILGVVGLVVVAPFYLASGLMAPAWAYALFIVLWLGFATLAVLWFRRRPLWVLALPVVAIAVWWAGMSAGGAWLDWTP